MRPFAVRDLIELTACIALCQAAGAVGSIFTAPAIPGWYATLEKPTLTPPSWVFAPVWITLYTLMGVALYLVWRKRGGHNYAIPALRMFALQLAFNAAWPWLFFDLQRLFAALVEIVILWAMALTATLLFRRVSSTASWLMVPYLLWLTFAVWLNYGYWRLNG